MSFVLRSADKRDFRKIKSLYKQAFPAEERAPFFLIKRRALQGKATVLTAESDGVFVGFAYLVCYRELVYLFYFAVDAEKRGSGFGSRILQELRERFAGRRIFLAREQLEEGADNYSQRVKRRDFYLSNGFADLPCRIKEAGVVYDVMGIGGNVSAVEYEALITGWSGRLLKKFVDMRILP